MGSCSPSSPSVGPVLQARLTVQPAWGRDSPQQSAPRAFSCDSPDSTCDSGSQSPDAALGVVSHPRGLKHSAGCVGMLCHLHKGPEHPQILVC